MSTVIRRGVTRGGAANVLALLLCVGCVAGIPKPEPVSAEPYEEGSPPEPTPGQVGSSDASPLVCHGAVVAGHPNYCFDTEQEACTYLECPSRKCDYAESMPVQVSCVGAD